MNRKNIFLFLLIVFVNLPIFAQYFVNYGRMNISGGYVVINGSCKNESSAEITLDGIVKLTGDWTNNSSTTVITGTGTNGDVVFEGITPQTIGGTATQSNFEKLTISTVSEVELPAGKASTAYGSTSIDGTFNLKSDATSTASFIGIGGISVSGIANSERYIAGSQWHITGYPITDQNIQTFFSNNASIPTNGINKGMVAYDESINDWGAFFTTSTPGILSAGTGYLARTTADGIIYSEGTLASSQVNVSLTRSGHGWNCLGNPYTSSIKVRGDVPGTDNFLGVNYLQLETGFEALYIFDPANPTLYRIINNAGIGGRYISQDYLQPGQGFLCRAKTTPGSASFTSNMQFHQNPVFYKKSANAVWNSIILKVSSNNTSATTAIGFREGMTTGLDITYDAGLLGGDPALKLYTNLIEDIGLKLAIQCLPDNNYDGLRIPIGIDFPSGGVITFNSELINLPVGCKAFLEDKTLGILTELNSLDDSYNVSLEANTSGTGRFFLKLSDETNNVINPESLKINIFAVGKEIFIKGFVEANTNAVLFDLSGQKLKTVLLQPSETNSFRVDEFKSGIYIIKILGNNILENKKVFIE